MGILQTDVLLNYFEEKSSYYNRLIKNIVYEKLKITDLNYSDVSFPSLRTN